MSHSPELHQRLTDANPVVQRLGNTQLHLMYQNCVGLWARLDSEFVECRRKRKFTAKYEELAKKLEEALVVLEQQLILGSLLNI